MDMINKYWAAQALALDIEMLQCESALSAISIESEANAKRAELKVMCENGTYDDLFELYREASEEASDKKKNIFVRMIEGISNFINSVVGKIGELFNKHKLTPEDENAQIEVPYKKGFPGSVQKAGNAITSTIDKVVNGQGNIVDISKLIGAVVGIMGAVGGGIFAFNNIRKGLDEKKEFDKKKAAEKATQQSVSDVSSTTTKKEARDDCSKINAVLRAVNKKLDSIKSRFEKPHEGFLKSTDGSSAKKDNVFKTLFTFVSDWSHAVSKKVTDTTSKIFSKLKPAEPEGDEHEESKFAPGQEPEKTKGRRNKRNQQRDQRTAANAAKQTANNNTYDVGDLANSAKQRQQGQGEDTTGESVDDSIDVSDDEGMAAFEAALDEIVNGEMGEAVEDNDGIVDESADDIEDEGHNDANDGDATDEEVDAAFESVAEEFDSLFNEDDDDEEGDE